VFVTGRPLALSAWRRAGLATGLALTLLGHGVAQAKGPPTDVGSVRLSELPREAQITDRLIRSDGPFPYQKDGTTFGNRERLLPLKPRGHYREYTVPTPKSRDRGARRIVCGGNPPSRPESCFYTDDHYASFKRIVQ
jgi:ribonuclease T1